MKLESIAKFSLIWLVCLSQISFAQPCGNNSKYGVSAPPKDCPKPGGDFFEPYTGNVQREIRDLELWGSVGELPMVWNHYYTSRGNILWNYSFVYSLYDGPVSGGQPTLIIDYPEGGQNRFTRNPSNANEWLPLPGIDKKLFQYGNDFILQMANGFRYRFTKFSLLIGSITYYYYLLVDIKDTKQNLYRLTYTANRQLDSVIEPGGRFFKVNYSIVGGRRLIGQVTTSDGRSVQYQYDIFNDGVSKWIRFTGASYGDGTQATYSYSQLTPGVPLRLEHAIDPRSTSSTPDIRFTYDWYIAGGYLKEEKNGVTGQVLSTLTATDSSRTVCYANGKQEVFQMPASLLGNRKSYTDGLGRTNKYGYHSGGQGFLEKDTDALNRVTTYNLRTIYGNLLKETYADGSFSSSTRDSLDLVLTQTDELGRVTTYTYDASHRVTRIDHPDASFETFTYNSFGQVLDHTQRNGGTEHFAYDSRGLRTTFTDALGNVTILRYDGADRLDSVTDARGNTTSYQYSERGLITKIIHPDLSAQTYTYNAFGNQLSKTDELGHSWTTSFDEFNRPVDLTDPLNRTVHYDYGLPGGVCGCAHEQNTPTTITLPSGKMIRIGYDVEWQKTSQTNGSNTADSATVSYEYDMVGNQVKMIDPNGKEWRTEYDLRDRKTADVDPLLHRTEWTYDAAGNVLTIKRPDNGITTNDYDVMNRMIKSIDPKNQITRFSYDDEGNLDSLIDPKGNAYSLQYDLLNRNIQMNYPGGTNDQFTFDQVSNLASNTNRAGVVRSYTYDSRNRETLSDWSDATPDVSRSYDAANRLLGISSSVSTMGYTYNSANELSSETQNIAGSGGGSKTISYGYNADGLAASLTYPGGTALTYSFNGRNLQDSMSDGSGPALLRFTYDLNGNRLTRTLKNGTTTDYAYDDDNQLLTVDHKTTSVSFSRYDYGYDVVHQRKFLQRDLGKGDVYNYDAVDQLTQVLYDANNPGGSSSGATRTVSYALDAAGNRTSVTDNSVATAYSSNNLNQYSSVGGTALTYDANGSLATFAGWTYTYDALNRLIAASNGGTSISFAYDGRNRCVRRTINGTSIYFYYDSWDLIEERNASDVLLQRYVHGSMTDELISKTAGSTTVYYHQNAVGDVIKLTNSSGVVVEQYEYDVFGLPTIRNSSGTIIASSAFSNRFLFTGREFIEQAFLYDYRNRMYSPELGRFLQIDPIRFWGDDVNMYRYVFNNPTNLTDGMGLGFWSSFGRGLVTGIVSAAVIAGTALAVVTILPAAATAVTATLFVVGVAGGVATIVSVINDPSADNIGYNLGALTGGILVGGATGRPLATRLSPKANKPPAGRAAWNPRRDANQIWRSGGPNGPRNPLNIINPKTYTGKGPNPMSTGPNALSGAGAVATGATGAAVVYDLVDPCK